MEQTGVRVALSGCASGFGIENSEIAGCRCSRLARFETSRHKPNPTPAEQGKPKRLLCRRATTVVVGGR